MVEKPPKENSRKISFIKKATVFKEDEFLKDFLNEAKKIREEMKKFNISQADNNKTHPTPSVKKTKVRERVPS